MSAVIGRPRPLSADRYRKLVLAGGFILATGCGIGLSSGAASAATPTLTIFAGTVPPGSGTPAPGPATDSPLSIPFGAVPDGAGNVYIGNLGSGDVVKVDSAGTLSLVGSAPCEPLQMAMAPNGDVLMADDCTTGLPEMTPSGIVSTVPGTSGYTHSTGVTVDPSGNIYFSNGFGNDGVIKVTPAGVASVFAPASDFGAPFSLASDGAGNIYVADSTRDSVDKITPAGTLSVIAGNVGGSTPATNYTLATPEGVVVDSLGDVLVSDTTAFKVLKVTPAGAITTVVGTGNQGAAANGNPLLSDLEGPNNLALDPAGNLYIADTSPAFDNAQALVEKVGNLAPPSAPTTGPPSLSGSGVVFPWSPIPGVTSYVVTLYVDGAAEPPISDLAGPSYTLTNPVPGATYSFTVAAVGGGGSGGPSAISASVTVPTPAQPSGYWTVAGDGGVFSFGSNFYGSAASLRLNQPVSAITSTSDAKGYWSVAKDGGVFTYGDALFHGSVPALGIHVSDIVGIAPDTATGGYWLVGADGGVYAFGAPFDGSVPGLGQHISDIVGIAPTPDGGGYYLVGADGAVYAFGDARYQGGANTLPHINAPIVGISVDSATGGYWLAGSDGGVYAYGAPFHGSAAGVILNTGPVVGISATTDGSGYYLVGSDGGVFSYDAPFLGSTGGLHLNAPMVGIAVAG